MTTTARSPRWLLLTAGLLLLVGAAGHATAGWADQRRALEAVAAPPELVGGLMAGWQFGTCSMLAFAAVVLIAALAPGPPSRPLFHAAAAVGLALTAFGLVFLVVRRLPFFVFFIALGAIVVTGARRALRAPVRANGAPEASSAPSSVR